MSAGLRALTAVELIRELVTASEETGYRRALGNHATAWQVRAAELAEELQRRLNNINPGATAPKP